MIGLGERTIRCYSLIDLVECGEGCESRGESNVGRGCATRESESGFSMALRGAVGESSWKWVVGLCEWGEGGSKTEAERLGLRLFLH